MALRLPTLEPLDEVYQRWWDPTFRLHTATVVNRWGRRERETRPHCGTWYPLPAPIPTTATWALVHMAFRPGRVLYVKSRAAGLAMLGKMPLQVIPTSA